LFQTDPTDCHVTWLRTQYFKSATFFK